MKNYRIGHNSSITSFAAHANINIDIMCVCVHTATSYYVGKLGRFKTMHWKEKGELSIRSRSTYG